jgi:hypothetical protein
MCDRHVEQLTDAECVHGDERNIPRMDPDYAGDEVVRHVQPFRQGQRPGQ